MGKEARLLNEPESTTRLNINFHQSSFLRKVAGQFRDYKINWESIEKRLAPLIKTRDYYHFVGLYGEEMLNVYLEEMMEKYPEKINATVIPQGIETENYRFTKSRNRTIIINKRSSAQDAVTDIDRLTLFDGIPVIWEVKIMPENTRKPWLYKKGLEMVDQAIGTNNLAKILYPIRELFGKTPGFVVVAENLGDVSRSQIRANFIRMGGLMVDLPEKRDSIYQKIKSSRATI